MSKKIETNEILGAHKLIRARELKLDKALVKHLYHTDEKVVYSALLCIRKLTLPGLAEHYQKIYWDSSQKIQLCILTNIRHRPRLEYKAFLLEVLFEESKVEVLVKALQAIGALATRGEHELVEILQERVSVGIKQDIAGEAAIESLFQAGDYDFLSKMIVELIPRANFDWRFSYVLQRFREVPHGPTYKRLYAQYQSLENPLSELGSNLIIGLFGTYDGSDAYKESIERVKRLILHHCTTESIDDAEFVLRISKFISPRDQDFLIQILATLLRNKSFSTRIDNIHRESFENIYLLIDIQKYGYSIKSALSAAIKTNLGELKYQQNLIKDRRSKSDGEQRNDILEFFENLGHQKLCDLFQAYLKSSTENPKTRVALVTLIKQMLPSFGKTQKKRVTSVLQYVAANHPARNRSSLAIEFSKIDFRLALDRLLMRLDFQLKYAAKTQECDYKVFRDLYECLTTMNRTKGIRLKLFRACLVSGDSNATLFSFKHIFELDESNIRKLFEKLPRISTRQTNAAKEIFYKNNQINKTHLHCLFSWLQALENFQDTEWSIILGKALMGEFGELPSGWEIQLTELMAEFCASSSQEYFLERITKKSYILEDTDLKALWKILKAQDDEVKNKFRRKVLSEFVYKLIKDENELYLPDLAAMLLELQDDYGKILMYQCLGPEHSAVIKKAVKYCRNFKLGAKWKTIFKLVYSDDFLLQKAATSFFEVDYKEFSQRELMQLVLQTVEGEKFDADGFEELAPAERKHLEDILNNLKTQRGSAKRQFARQKDMQELTVFFIDIVGYTTRTAASSIDELMSMLEDFEQIIKPIGDTHDGVLIKKIGDCFMYTFQNPMNAILFSLDVKRSMSTYNEYKHESQKVHTRIGLATGEVYVKEKDVYGDVVNLASRVEGRAPLDGLLVHESTLKGLESFFEVEAWEPVTVKGIEEPINVYEVIRSRAGVKESYLAV